MSDISAPTLVLLAAGMASRYGSAKQLERVGPGGETLMEYSLHDAIQAGFGRVVFVVRQDSEPAIHEMARERFAGRIEVATAPQRLTDLPNGHQPPPGRTKPWGTVQAVLAAEPAVRGPFAVANADDFYGPSGISALADFLRAADPRAAEFALVGYRLAATLSEHGGVTRALCVTDAEGWLESLEEATDVGRGADGGFRARTSGGVRPVRGDDLVSMNLWGFTPAIFPILRRGFAEFLAAHGGEATSELVLPTALGAAVAAGEARVRVLDAGREWFGLTHAADRPLVQEALAGLVAAGRYPASLWA